MVSQVSKLDKLIANAGKAKAAGKEGKAARIEKRIANVTAKSIRTPTVGDIVTTDIWQNKTGIVTAPSNNGNNVRTDSLSGSILAAMGLTSATGAFDTGSNARELDPTGMDQDLSDILNGIPMLSNAGNTSFDLPDITVNGSGESSGSQNGLGFIYAIVIVIVVVMFIRR